MKNIWESLKRLFEDNEPKSPWERAQKKADRADRIAANQTNRLSMIKNRAIAHQGAGDAPLRVTKKMNQSIKKGSPDIVMDALKTGPKTVKELLEAIFNEKRIGITTDWKWDGSVKQMKYVMAQLSKFENFNLLEYLDSIATMGQDEKWTLDA